MDLPDVNQDPIHLPKEILIHLLFGQLTLWHQLLIVFLNQSFKSILKPRKSSWVNDPLWHEINSISMIITRIFFTLVYFVSISFFAFKKVEHFFFTIQK